MRDCIDIAMKVTLTKGALQSNTEKKFNQLGHALLSCTSDSDLARNVLSLCLNGLNENNWKGIAEAQEFIKTMVLQIPDRRINELVGLIDIVKKKLPDLLPEHFQKKPKKTENAILYFHFHASKLPAYEYIALQCHRALKHVESVLRNEVLAEIITPEMAKKRLEKMVIPFLHIVLLYEVDPSEKYQLSLDSKKIVKALKKGQSSNLVRYTAKEVFETYERDVNSANSGTFTYYGRSKKKECEWGLQTLFGRSRLIETISEDEVGSPTQFSSHIYFDDNALNEAAEGGYALENAVENGNEFSDDDVIRKLMAEQIRPAQFPSFYQHGISLNAFNILLNELLFKYENLDKISDTQISIIAYLLLLSFYGFNPKKALNLKICPSLTDPKDHLLSEDLYIDFELSRFLYKSDSDLIVKAFSQSEENEPDRETYLKTTNVISLPILSIGHILREVYKRKKRRNSYLFDLTSESTRETLFENFKIATRKALQETAFAAITPNTISKSFYGYSVNKYKIDPIVIELITGRASREFRAPRFYTATSSARIHSDLRVFHKSFLADLLKNAKEMGLLFRKELFDQEVLLVENKIIGSTYVPLRPLLRDTLQKIRTVLEENSLGRIEYHNLWTLYSVLIVMFTTAMRPVEIERLRNFDINSKDMSVSVSGKNNRLFSESRIIPAPQMTFEVFMEAIKENTALTEWLIESGRSSSAEIRQQPDLGKAFFFASEAGILRPVSSKNIRSFIEHTPGLEFLFKLNAPRHLLRTFLFEKKVPYFILNAFIGHQTSGKEFLSYYSLFQLDNLRQLSKAIEELAEELGLTVKKSREIK